jgi:uncharacterized protein YkwD
MNSTELNTLQTPNHYSKNSNHNLRLTLLFALLTLGPSAMAQSLQPRPAVRLISGSATDASFTRPRRVKAAENAAVETPVHEAVHSTSVPNSATAIERRAFEQANRARVESGLAPLVWDAELCRLARVHSERMAKAGFFSHQTPEGLQLKERAHGSGLHFRVIGENIAYNKGYDDPGGFAVERWMNSSGHRANILYTGFQTSAIGSYVSADGSTYLTQVFIAR